MIKAEKIFAVPDALLMDSAVRHRTRVLSEALAWSQAQQLAMAELLIHARHELRSPLHSILGYADLLRRSRSMDRLDECSEAIVDAGARLLESIDGLLMVNATSSDACANHPKPVDWQVFFHALTSDAKILARGMGNTSVVRDSGTPPRSLLLDAGRLRSVIRMLLIYSNHVALGGEILMESDTRCDAHHVYLGLRLHCGAIGEADPQGHAELQTSTRWIERLGGRLRIDVTPIGALEILLELTCPIVVGPAATTAVSAADQFSYGYQGRARRILIADDDIVNRTLLEEVLVSTGFVVVATASGREAMACIDASIDLLITDQVMDDGDGWELLQALRHRLPNCPSVMLTGNEQSDVPPDGMQFTSVLRKPADFQQLLSLVGKLLDLQWRAGPQLSTRSAPAFSSAALSVGQRRELGELVELGLVTDILDFARSLQAQALHEEQRKLAEAIIGAVSQLDFAYLYQLIDSGTAPRHR